MLSSGVGLSPLSGSLVLQRIDLSLVDQYESPHIEPAPAISPAAVIPILNSIIAGVGNSLAHVQLPKKWRNDRNDESVNEFLERYDRLLGSRRYECRNAGPRRLNSCEQICEVHDDEGLPWVVLQNGERYGLQR